MTNRGYSTIIHSNNSNHHHRRTIVQASLTEAALGLVKKRGRTDADVGYLSDRRENQAVFLCLSSENKADARVPGLPIRDCARGCNNCVYTRAQMSAIDVTKKKFLKRLYQFQDWAHLGQLSLCTQNPAHSVYSYFLISDQFFPPDCPSFFWYTIHQLNFPSPCSLADAQETHVMQ